MRNKFFKKIFVLIVVCFVCISCKNVSKDIVNDKTSASENNIDINNDKKNVLYVYNWGIYLDESVITKFENKYNCKVVYDTFDTNEEMYIVVKEGARVYDVLCPTDYMIEKMINKELLYDYDIKELPNYKQIDKRMLNIMQAFDPDNIYAVPYVHSTIGLIYNKTLLDEKNLPYPKKWADLWNPIYTNEIILQDAMRDVMMVGLKKNNFSLNTTKLSEINIARDDLIRQKPINNSYLIDQARDKMAEGEASIAVMYSGEVEYIKSEGKKYKYEYILPIEGVNFTIDAWVIPKNAKNIELAKKWIDFMLEPEIALLNFDYMHYGIANLGAINLIKESDREKMLNDTAIFPDLDDIDKYELYKDLGVYESKYSEAYKRIKS